MIRLNAASITNSAAPRVSDAPFSPPSHRVLNSSKRKGTRASCAQVTHVLASFSSTLIYSRNKCVKVVGKRSEVKERF